MAIDLRRAQSKNRLQTALLALSAALALALIVQLWRGLQLDAERREWEVEKATLAAGLPPGVDRREQAAAAARRERMARHPYWRVRYRLFRNDVPLGPGDVAFLLPLLRDENDGIRQKAAERLGDLVAKEAVPALIELLRDPEQSVRKEAADALTKIRFDHEQQAHWDRVLKGLDASPASAAEKLLLQARPDQPRAQRLLALQSLGVLGVPEALPFLIEWTSAADEEIAAAAREAITQIHLNPRR